jgi:hypothetical protein
VPQHEIDERGGEFFEKEPYALKLGNNTDENHREQEKGGREHVNIKNASGPQEKVALEVLLT